MSKHLWPLSPPQLLKVSDCIREPAEIDVNNNDILQTVPLPQTNVLIMLTPARVLVYNMKPIALVASHERSKESITEFGLNKSMTQSVALDGPIEGLISHKQCYNMASNQGKLVIYVITKKNFLLTYQILKNSTNVTTFKEYGIPVVDFAKVHEDLDQDYDDAMDDDTLTVFEKNKSSKIIQNGYAITKEKGFLQFLSTNQDNLDELPVKKLELRLKVVLKFDYEILDLFGFKRLSESGDGKAEENLLVLFPHGLQFLSLIDFKLKSSSLVELANGKKICISDSQLMVLSQDSETNITSINHIEIQKQNIDTIQLETEGSLLACFELRQRVALVFQHSIMYYNSRLNKLDYACNTPVTIKLCDKLNDHTLLIISKSNTVHFFTELGNPLFYSSSEEDATGNTLSFDYSGFTYVDMMLVTVSHSGDYQIWNLWEESRQTFSDFRSPTSYVLHNANNDITLYSPSGDSPSNHDNLQFIKLPTRTINNCVPLIKVNSTMKLMAVYVSNKNILLIQNMDTNVWYSFTETAILDMHWLGGSYLVCQIKREDWTMAIQCFHFPLQGLDTSEISKYRIWEYEIPPSISLLSLHVNTSNKFKMLKIKSRDSEEMEIYSEKFYRTAEVIIVTAGQIIIFAVISSIHPSGMNCIKKFHEHAKIDIPSDVVAHKIDWIANYRDGLLYYSENKIIKVAKLDNTSWESLILIQDVDRIIDVLADQIFLVSKHQKLVYSIEDLWDEKPPLLSIPLDDDFYPISVSPEMATTHGLHCIFHEEYTKLVVKHKIYLDRVITAKLAQNVDNSEIMAEYRPIRHYKFALEKILSTKVLEGEPLDGIVELVKLCDRPPGGENILSNSHSDMLEIVSNCLRKMEIKHWSVLFSSLKMTPRDLLARCLEGNEAKILGVLLLVFLNYDAELVEDLRSDDQETKDEKSDFKNSDAAVVDLIRDQEMMLRVLRLLVTSAANTFDSSKAADSWDMCFQLMRLLKELDKENNTSLVQEALNMFQ